MFKAKTEEDRKEDKQKRKDKEGNYRVTKAAMRKKGR